MVIIWLFVYRWSIVLIPLDLSITLEIYILHVECFVFPRMYESWCIRWYQTIQFYNTYETMSKTQNAQQPTFSLNIKLSNQSFTNTTFNAHYQFPCSEAREGKTIYRLLINPQRCWSGLQASHLCELTIRRPLLISAWRPRQCKKL